MDRRLALVSARSGWPVAESIDEQMITRMRKALEFVVAGTDGYEHKQTDLAWLRSSLMAARGAALAVLGR